MPPIHLLPPNATPFEQSFSEAADLYDRINAAGIAGMRGFKYSATPAEFYPFLVFEYGLGPISSYFADYASLIAAGVGWQRLRGTPSALALAMGWIGYDATSLEDSKPTRRLWTRYQQKMGRVPTAAEEDPLLYDAEYLSGLSDPARSVFFRGFEGYDVRPIEWSQRRWGSCLWGDSSGVRMPNGDTKWSHGENYEASVTLTAAQKQELGLDVTVGTQIGWWPITPATPGVTASTVTDPSAYKSHILTGTPAYLGFYDAADQPIGYRRCFGVKDVTADQPPTGETVYVRFKARTDFGEGFGSTCAKIALMLRARPTDPKKPGLLWLGPGELTFDDDFNAANLQTEFVALAISFRQTVREHVTITVEV